METVETTSSSVEFLSDFREIVNQDTSLGKGSAGSSYQEQLDEIVEEAKGFAECQTDQFFEHASHIKKQERHTELFAHNFSRSVRFIALIAFRSDTEYPPLASFVNDAEFRRGVLKTLARQSRRSARLLSSYNHKTGNYEETPPTTWGAVKAHLFAPEDIDRIITKNPDLDLTVIVKCFKNKPSTINEELVAVRDDIHTLLLQFPGLPRHEAVKARLNYPSDPTGRIRIKFPGISENGRAKLIANELSGRNSRNVQGADVQTRPDRQEIYRRNLEKVSDIIKLQLLPRYLVEHFCRSNINILGKIDWALEMRGKLLEIYGMNHGLEAIHVALKYRDPVAFMSRYAEVSSELTLARSGRTKNNEFVRKKSGTIKISNSMLVNSLQQFNLESEHRKYENLEFPVGFIEKITQMKIGEVESFMHATFNMIDDLSDDPKTAFIGKERLALAVFEGEPRTQQLIRAHQHAFQELQKKFPNSHPYILLYAYQNSAKPEQFAENSSAVYENMRKHNAVHVLGEAFALFAATRFIENPETYVNEVFEVYLKMIQAEKYISLGARLIKIALLRDHSNAREFLDGILNEIEEQADRPQNHRKPYADIREEVVSKYRTGLYQ